ncbi:polysaccharide deacetylase family protein [Pseudalkalibacillus berkeleyi]|uniref:Polysaccharide deacetylase family protein n=1 Tax=Pseudalkalibacillus berkeleyi TaxID=1069813 RepID=A0ABS9GUW1_9BACL|nr:polysaccharide deacetylase family protein [Pseudalkalibacillus berkeleyi]MCF6136633.1 polysaccharide deacetylase family protein [Pseudalkalibacillus berkeleyi]
METIVWILYTGFIIFIVYGILPTVMFRTMSMGLIKKGQNQNTLALTFDDGPNPHYTPQVLDLLKQYQCKATFFLIAEKALEHPDLVKRIVAEGHIIGIHHYAHTNSWLLSPTATKREIGESAAILEKITGEKPGFYRPPYGRMNVFTLWFSKDYRIVLWSSIFQDWKKQDADVLFGKMRKRLGHGEIFLLHDDGSNPNADEIAPESTIEALRNFIPEALAQGYKCVNLHEHLKGKSVEEQKRIL